MWIEVWELTAKQEEEDWYDLADCKIVSRFFFSIDNFAKYIDYDGTEYVSFYNGGMEWISILTLKQFIENYILKPKHDENKTKTSDRH
jgi:hypothetical protein